MLARIYALDTWGHILWMRDGTSGAYPALALDRAGGDVWLADPAGLQRLSPAGARRWRITWPGTPGARETLVLDARATAYTCGSDGVLRAVSPAGHVPWQYRFTPPRYGFVSAPNAALDPAGSLYVASASAAGIVVFAR